MDQRSGLRQLETTWTRRCGAALTVSIGNLAALLAVPLYRIQKRLMLAGIVRKISFPQASGSRVARRQMLVLRVEFPRRPRFLLTGISHRA